MAEYINRDAYIRYLSSRKAEFVDDFWQGWCAGIDTAISACEKFPAADVAPVRHAHWDVNGRCTACGGHAPFWCMAYTYYKSPFCPNCGAKMDEEARK